MGIEPVSQWQKQNQVLDAHFTTVPLWLVMSFQLVLLGNLWLNCKTYLILLNMANMIYVLDLFFNVILMAMFIL